MAKPSDSQSPRARRRASYQDVLDAPEHMVAEIVGGILHTNPRPSLVHAYSHTSLVSRLTRLLGRGGNNGPGGWLILLEPELHLGEDILVPDVAGWRKERMPGPPETAYATIAPDWVCEILSPSTRTLDLGAKRDVYAREGIGHLWFVDPIAQTLEVFELRDGQWTLLEAATGKATVSPPPFSPATFELGDLWWTTEAEPGKPSTVHESPAAPYCTAAQQESTA